MSDNTPDPGGQSSTPAPRRNSRVSRASESKSGSPAKRPASAAPKPRQKKIRLDPHGSISTSTELSRTANLRADDDANATPADITPRLPPVDIAEERQTRVLKIWIAAVKSGKLKIKQKVPYTPVPPINARVKLTSTTRKAVDYAVHEPVHISQAPVYDNRAFRVVGITKDTAKRRYRRSGTEKLAVFSIYVNDANHPYEKPLVLYGQYDQDQAKLLPHTQLRGGALDSNICKDESDSFALGDACCRLLDRFPSPIRDSDWPNINNEGPILQRRIIEMLGLREWQPDFDYARLHELFRPAYRTWFRYVTRSTRSDKKYISVSVPTLRIDIGDDIATEQMSIQVNPSELIYDKIRHLPAIPATFPHKVTVNATGAAVQKLPNEERKLLLKTFQYIQYNMVGYVGTIEQLEKRLKTLIRPLTAGATFNVAQHYPAELRSKTHRTHRGLNGPYGGHGLVTIMTAKGVRVRIVPGTAVQKSVEGTLVQLSTSHQSRLPTTYIINQILHAFYLGADILETWQVGVLALDAITKGEISQTDILELQCRCTHATDRAKACHACALCWRVHRRVDLVPMEDARLVCSTHNLGQYAEAALDTYANIPKYAEAALDTYANIPKRRPDKKTRPYTISRPRADIVDSEDSISFLRGRGSVTISVRVRTREDGLQGSGTVSQNALVRKLEQAVVDAERGIWKDAYNGERLISEDIDASHLPKASSKPLIGPKRATMDAVRPFVLIDGEIFIHHQDNIVLTAWAYNLLHSYWPAIVLPIFKKAAQQTKREKDGAAWDSAFWKWFDTAMDHVHHIVRSYHKTKKGRFLRAITPETMSRFEEGWRTGIWTAQIPSPYEPAKIFASPAEIVTKNAAAGLVKRGKGLVKQGKGPRVKAPTGKEFRKPWPMWTEEYKKQLAELVNEIEKCPITNLRNLTIKRSANGAPWPFREDHFLSKEYDLWTWWHREAILMFWSIDDVCALDHEIEESPARIMLELVVQWFEKGGVDDYIHCEMTIWDGSPQRVSIGRSANVAPGSVMRTGFTVDYPTSFAAHYERSRRTVTIQPWFVNLYWWQFSPKVHDELFQMMLDIADSTEHYDEPCTNLVSLAHNYPKETRVSRVERREKETGVTEVGDTSIDDNDANSEDEEELPLENDNVTVRLPDEAPEETKDALLERLSDFRDEIETSYPDNLADDFITTLLTQCEMAADTLDSDALDSHIDSIRMYLEQGIDPADQVRKHLSGKLAQFETRLQMDHAEKADDELITTSIAALKDAIQSGNVEGFNKHYEKVLEYLQQAPSNCAFCEDPDDELLMVFCSNPEHEEPVIMHCHHAGFDSIPSEFTPMLCPTCQQANGLAFSGGLGPGPEDQLVGSKNLVNLGLTCYTSSTLQIIYRIKTFRDVVLDGTKIVAKPAQQSGRIPKNWLPGCYVFNPTTPEKEILKMSATHMSRTQQMVKQLRHLFMRMADQGEQISRSEMESFFNSVHNIDPNRFNKNVMDDSADFFSELLQQLILLTDDSTTTDAQQRARQLDQEQQERNEDLNGRQPILEADSLPRFDAYVSLGKASVLVGSFCIQVTKEWQCQTADCGRVARSFEHSEQLLLSFPEATGQDKTYTLAELLHLWANEGVADPLRCPHLPELHSPDNIRRKQITICPNYLMIQFGRQAGSYLNFVDIPEYLDLTPYADDVKLPSENETGQHSRPSKYCIYRLIAVNVYIAAGLHYVAYVVSEGNTWVYLDDNPSFSAGGRARHPQQAMNDGHISYYVIYEKVKDRKTLPFDDDTKKPTSGHVLVRNAPVPPPKCKDYSWTRPTRHPCPAADSYNCTLWFDTEEEATDHSISHFQDNTAGPSDDGSSKHPCPAAESHGCTMMFATVEEANDHANAQHYQDDDSYQPPPEVFCCTTCGQSFETEIELDDHAVQDHGDGMDTDYECEICKSVYKTSDELEQHVNQVHTENVEQFACGSCGQNFTSENDMRDHQNEAHPPSNNLQQQLKQLRETMAAADRAHEKRRHEEQEWRDAAEHAHEVRRQEEVKWRADADAAHKERERRSLLREKRQIAVQMELLAARAAQIDEEIKGLEGEK